MPDCFFAVNNRRGSLMFIVLLIMATLTIAAMMVTQDTIMENRVARNYAIDKQNMYLAEASTKQASQSLDLFDSVDEAEILLGQSGAPVWLNKTGTDFSFFEDATNWAIGANASAALTNGATGVDSDAFYAVDCEPQPTASGDVVNIVYHVYGQAQSNNDNGEALIEIGFRKAVRIP